MLMAMATKAAVSVEEYLAMSFDGPAPELVDGEIVERGEVMYPHAKAQIRLGSEFEVQRQNHKLFAATEMRLRLDPEIVRVADLAVFRNSEPTELIPSAPPILVAEIVSRDDRYIDILGKLGEYRDWGVEHVWLVDPWLRRLSVFDGDLHSVRSLSLPDIGIEITPEQLFD
jgi:Uma2 family endonuclease